MEVSKVIIGTSLIFLTAYVFEQRKKYVQNRKREQVVQIGQIIMEKISDQEESKKWLNQKLEGYYNNVSVDIIKTGKVFKSHCDFDTFQYNVNNNIMREIEAMKQYVDSHRPLNYDLIEKISNKMGIHLNYNSNAIEGSTITLEQTEIIVLQLRSITHDKISEVLDVVGHQRAMVALNEIFYNNQSIIEYQDVLALHTMIMTSNNPIAGTTRDLDNIIVSIKGVKTLLAHPLEVPILLNETITIINSLKNCSSKNIVELIADVHMRLVKIHPFPDGNGRLTRLICCLLSMKFGYGVLVFRVETKDEYIKAIRAWENEKNTELITNYIAQEMKYSLNNYVSSLKISAVNII